MTRALSVTKLLEDMHYFVHREQRNLSGSIGNLVEFQAQLDALEDAFDGLYCFLAFHPAVDKAVAEYVTAGSLGSDAGRRILALFVSGEEFRQPKVIKTNDLLSALKVDTDIYPAHEMVMWLFPDGKRPVLPGLVLFGGKLSGSEVIFASLAGEQDMKAVADVCRKVFTIAENCWINGLESLSDRICAELKREYIAYERNKGMSLREWLVASTQFVKEHKESLASAVFEVAKTAL